MIDLKELVKQDKGGGEQSLPSASLEEKIITQEVVKTQGVRYFYAQRASLSFFMGGKHYAFKGNYFETTDMVLADYILQHYSQFADEITQEQKIDGQTIKG